MKNRNKLHKPLNRYKDTKCYYLMNYLYGGLKGRDLIILTQYEINSFDKS